LLHIALFNFKDDLLEINDLTEDHVQSAVSLVSELLKCEQRRDKSLFSSEGLVLTASHLAPIIKHDWLMADAVRWCYLFTVQLGTPRGRYDEYSSKVFPLVKKPRYVDQERKEPND
jgi:hypothetical protein